MNGRDDRHDRPTTDADRDRPSCTATTTAGEACRGRPIAGGRWCWSHDPALEDLRTEARVRGGRNSSTVARRWASLPDPVADTLEVLRAELDDLRADRVTPAHASAAASLGRAIVGVWDVGVLQTELDDLAEHVAATSAGRHLRALP